MAFPVRYLYTTDIFFHLNTKIIYRIVFITDHVITNMSNREFLKEKGRVSNPNIVFVSFFCDVTQFLISSNGFDNEC